MTPPVPGWGRVVAALGDVDGADVVDLACGGGEVAHWLVERAGARSVLGLDLDPDALDRARAGGDTGDARDRLRFEQADLEQLTLPFEAYDVAWVPGVMATTPDPVRTARMLRAGLRPYGRVVATVPPDAAARVAAALGEALLDEVVVIPAGADAAEVAHLGAAAPTVVVTARKPPRRRP